MKAWKQHVKLMTVYFLVCHRLSGACIRELAWKKEKAVIWGNFQFLSPFFMSFRTFISPPHPNYRYSQASYRGSFCHAWWVWAAKPGEALRDYIKQRGRPECGNSGGGRQEDAGETWQRQRHYLCPYCHEHGEQSYQQHFLWRRHLVVAYDCLFLPLLLPLVMCKVFFC